MTKIITPVRSISEFIDCVKTDFQSWKTATYPWFRGEPLSKTPLLPKLYRPRSDGSLHDENQLLQFFRMKAPEFGKGIVPPRIDHNDQWLFLAQHVKLPTRLLDWSEGALVALYFALLEENPIVWMLNPIGLNRLSISKGEGLFGDNQFPLTWVKPKEKLNIGFENIRGAWFSDKHGMDLPVAVHPTNIHPRMSAQRSCFTVHGKKKQNMNDLVPPGILIKYEIEPSVKQSMLVELHMLGISHSTIFPDLDGLAEDLAQRF